MRQMVVAKKLWILMWINDVFYYSVGNLKGIAEHYESLYTNAHLAVLYYVAESKADFDRALDNIGRGKWRGLENHKFGAYKYFGKQQQTVIADIIFGEKEGKATQELERYGFYEISQLRGNAYHNMGVFINEIHSYDLKTGDSQS